MVSYHALARSCVAEGDQLGSKVLWIWALTLRKGVGSVDPLAREETTNPIFAIHPAQTRYVAEAC